MAYRNQRNQTQGTQGTQRPRECKVCVDAGKTPDECTSHWVKDRSGNVTCPTLLNQKCLLCGKCGHTTSYCKAVIAKPTVSSSSSSSVPSAPIKPKPKPVTRPMCSNKYALLGILEQEQQEQQDQEQVAFPPLEEKPQITRPAIGFATTTGLGTWASRINSPPPQPPQQQQQQQQQRQLPITRKPTRPTAIAVSWAD